MLTQIHERHTLSQHLTREIGRGLRAHDLAAVRDRFQPRRTVDRRTEIVAVAQFRDAVSIPIRARSGSLTVHGSAFIASSQSMAARTVASAVANTARTPSPRPFTRWPPCATTPSRKISSCLANAALMAFGSWSHSRVETSRSVNKKATVPDGSSAS